MSSANKRVLTVTGGPVSKGAMAGRRRAAAHIAAAARKLTSVYEAEWFVSSLLGQLWEQRARAPQLEGVDLDLVLAGPLVEDLARYGGRGSRLVLHAIGRLVPGPLGTLAAGLAERSSEGLAHWTREIGRSQVVAATGEASPGDGIAVLLEVRGVGMVDHAIAVFISERDGGCAKHLGLLYDRGRWPGDVDAAFAGTPWDVAGACERVLAAIAVTDAWLEAPLGDGFPQLRTLVLARAVSTPTLRVVDASMN